MQAYIIAAIVGVGVLSSYFSYDYGGAECVNDYLVNSTQSAQAFQTEMRSIRKQSQKEINDARINARLYKTKVDALTRKALKTNPEFKAYYDAPVHDEALAIIFGDNTYSNITK